MLGVAGVVWVTLLVACVGVNNCTASATRPPNVIVVNIDDVGTEQFKFYGSNVSLTPNIDAFEKEAVRFDNFFAQPLCGPSRAALFSGRWPSDTGIIYNKIADMALSDLNVSRAECTIGQVFKQGGYDTAIVGKVHNFIKFSGRFDSACGFDMWHLWSRDGHRFFGADVLTNIGDETTEGLRAFKTAVRRKVVSKQRRIVHDSGLYTPFMNRDLVLAFLSRHATKQRSSTTAPPFFLLWPMVLAHGTKEETEDTLPKPGASPEEEFGLRIQVVDKIIGKVLTKLKDTGLASSTVVLLVSDNGSPRSDHGWYKGRRIQGGKKINLVDEGSRVLGLMRYPAGFQHSVITDPVSMTDIVPTLAEAAGLTIPEGQDVSTGESFWNAAITGKSTRKKRWVFTYSIDRSPAVVAQNTQWKVTNDGEIYRRTDFFELSLQPATTICDQGKNVLAMTQDLFRKTIDFGYSFTMPGTTTTYNSVCQLVCNATTRLPECK
eukprot:m.13101 g.13101  ORF g.13101 m.13101 type:complete len:490 (+) comp5899_c0_seq2:145-1614(+)